MINEMQIALNPNGSSLILDPVEDTANQPIVCSQNHKAQNVCLNSNCPHKVLLCHQKSCQCFKKHRGCIKSSIQSIAEALEEKIISIEPFQTRINDLINQAIDELSVFAETIIEKAHQTLDYLGLTQSQRKFIKIVKNGQNHPITGKQMHEIYQSIDNVEQFTTDMLVVENKINITWNSFDTEMKKSFSTIKKLLNILTEGGASQIFGGSKIIKKYEERINITRFLHKKIKQTSLLYRASENNFKVDEFYSSCKDIPNTLVVCKTEYNKVIGGFSAMTWQKLEGQEKFFEDDSQKSFLFSLTNNDLFKLQPRCYATKYCSGGGPTFGNTSGLDLSICDKANTVRNSVGNVNCAYHNEKYNNGNPNSWEAFSGSKDFNFLLKEWEVWHVEFQN